MDEKTEELREIFMSVSEEGTVTDEQEETPGSLAPDDDRGDRLREVVESMRAEREFATTLSVEQLTTVVREFYDGQTDAAIADAVDASRGTVFRARMDLHLLREADLDSPVDPAAVDEGTDAAALADRFDTSEAAVRRYRRALDTHEEILRVNDRYRDEFETVLQDPELADRFTTHESGLEGATADQEVDVSF